MLSSRSTLPTNAVAPSERPCERQSVRIGTPQEVQYYQHGGILQFVLRQLLERK